MKFNNAIELNLYQVKILADLKWSCGDRLVGEFKLFNPFLIPRDPVSILYRFDDWTRDSLDIVALMKLQLSL